MWIVPATIGVIFLLLYMAFKRAREALIVRLCTISPIYATRGSWFCGDSAPGRRSSWPWRAC